MKTINRTELRALQEGGDGVVLIDVTPAECFQAAHLQGAKNCCVYEVGFLEQVAAMAGKERPVVVYGTSAHSLASCTAAEKLERAGYGQVRDYRGGIEDWVEGGLPVEGGGELPPEEGPREGRHEIDVEKCHVVWTGRNINGAHSGTIGVKSGWLEVEGRKGSGEITLDMESIANTDLTDTALNRMLIAHLKSDDFFDAALHPTATFQLRHVTLNPHARPGSINADIDGALTLKGVTEDLGFPALIEVLPEAAR